MAKKVKKKKAVESETLKATEGDQNDSPEVDNSPANSPVMPDSPAVAEAKRKAAAMIAEAEQMDKNRATREEEYKKAGITVFVSRYSEHCITMLPILIKTNSLGQSEMVSQGKDIQFHNKIYQTSDPAEIAFLKARPSFGSVINLAQARPDDIKKEVEKKISN